MKIAIFAGLFAVIVLAGWFFVNNKKVINYESKRKNSK